MHATRLIPAGIVCLFHSFIHSFFHSFIHSFFHSLILSFFLSFFLSFYLSFYGAELGAWKCLFDWESLKRRVLERKSLVQASKYTCFDDLNGQGFDLNPNRT